MAAMPDCPRPSAYNLLTKIPESEQYLLSNFFHGTQRLLSSREAHYLENISEAPEEFVCSMLKDGYLTEQDETAVLRERYEKNRHFNEALKLTVAPTMACNFACTYCFEHSRGGRMDEKTQDELIRFAENRLRFFGSKKLLVAWYGGEPMLCMDIIESLSRRFIALCERLGVEYSARIITNGWFFTPENVRVLDECRVTDAQITLDGTARQHDAHRPLKNGGGTYARIVENLRNIKTDMQINLRCNFHKDNLVCADELLALVKELRKSTGVRFFLEPARVVLNNYTDRNDASSNPVQEVNPTDYCNMVCDLSGRVQMPKTSNGTCATLRDATYVVDPEGNLCKCWEDLGREDSCIGHISGPEGPETAEELKNLKPFAEAPFPADTEFCRDCVLLPVCMGGCPNARQKRGANRCLPFKEDPHNYALRCYMSRKDTHQN